MDLFDIKLRLRVVSKSHSVRDNKVDCFECLHLADWKSLLRADRLHSNYPVNQETCKVHKLLQPFEVSSYHLFVISSSNNQKNCQFHSLNGLSAAYIAYRKKACRKKTKTKKKGNFQTTELMKILVYYKRIILEIKINQHWLEFTRNG